MNGMDSFSSQPGDFDYIECLFLSDDNSLPRPAAIEGCSIHSVASALAHLERRLAQGLRYALLVAVNAQPALALAQADDFCVRQLLLQARRRWGQAITLIADVGLSPYQESGHSVINTAGNIDVEASYQAVVQLAAAFAQAGADAVAPCLSLPQQTRVIRETFDAAQLSCGVFPYSTKFSSSLYGPYRQAIGSKLGTGRKSYQFDFCDTAEAINQTEEDLRQGAVATIVKPALPYLDVLAETVRRSSKPVAVYHVSGEFMMARLASRAGLLNENDYYDEIHAAFRRCGARWIIGYAADHFLRQQHLNL
jgi:porphobilinogen synthase